MASIKASKASNQPQTADSRQQKSKSNISNITKLTLVSSSKGPGANCCDGVPVTSEECMSYVA